MQQPSRLKISDLDPIPSTFEQELTIEEAEKVVGGKPAKKVVGGKPAKKVVGGKPGKCDDLGIDDPCPIYIIPPLYP